MDNLTQEQIIVLQKCLWGWGESEGQVPTEIVREISSKLDSLFLQNIKSTEPASDVVPVPRFLLVRLFNYSDKRMPVMMDDLHELRALLNGGRGE
jgi:hypothetical protein